MRPHRRGPVLVDDGLSGGIDRLHSVQPATGAPNRRDPSNTEWQSDLSFSYERIGEVLVSTIAEMVNQIFTPRHLSVRLGLRGLVVAPQRAELLSKGTCVIRCTVLTAIPNLGNHAAVRRPQTVLAAVAQKRPLTRFKPVQTLENQQSGASFLMARQLNPLFAITR